ncbi:MAG: class I SAM-dependent methyltransferase [Fimbriiglobus sp.]
MTPIPDPPLDLIEYVSGVPDADLARRIGYLHRDFFVNSCGLQPHHRVLDVGCGIGRVAAALTETLNADGSYEAFDISLRAVQWCQDNIHSRFPKFRFQQANLFNEFYNPNGPIRARRFRFPYASNSFDFVYLMSVFTHMLPHDLQHYLCEISRVLKPNGRCVMTFFVHDSETARLIRDGKSTFQLPCRNGSPQLTIGDEPTLGEYRTETITEPERVVAYEREGLLDRLKQSGIRVDEIVPGSWSGREGPGFQDILVTTKTGSVSPLVHARRWLRFEALREWLWSARRGRMAKP